MNANGALIPRPAEVRNSLEQIVEVINGNHRAGLDACRRGWEHFRKAGAALLEAKLTYGRHGEWGKWLEKHVPAISDRQARRYMELAKTDVTSDLASAWKIICGNDNPRITVSVGVSSPPPQAPTVATVTVKDMPQTSPKAPSAPSAANGIPELKEMMGAEEVSRNEAAEVSTGPPDIRRKGIGSVRGHECVNILSRVPRDDALRGRGFQLVYDIVNILSRIPGNDGLRKRGFQIVMDWLRRNQ